MIWDNANFKRYTPVIPGSRVLNQDDRKLEWGGDCKCFYPYLSRVTNLGQNSRLWFKHDGQRLFFIEGYGSFEVFGSDSFFYLAKGLQLEWEAVNLKPINPATGVPDPLLDSEVIHYATVFELIAELQQQENV